jgi:hypothetical protein
LYGESGRLQVEERFRMGGTARRSLAPPLDRSRTGGASELTSRGRVPSFKIQARLFLQT